MAVDKLMNETQGDDIIDCLEDIADKIHDINYGLETSSNKVVSMSGYQKSTATTPGAISTGDTLNEAVGKLEKRIDGATQGPSSSTDEHLVMFDGTSGKAVKDSGLTIADSDDGMADSDTQVPTSKNVKKYVDETATGISRYLGTVDALNELSTDAKKGDFYIVSTAWTGVHIKDEIIAEKNGPSQTIDGVNWKLLHNDENTDENVAQSPVTTNADYEILFSGTADNTPHTEGTGKDTGIKFNPSTDKLTVAGNVSANGFEGNGIDKASSGSTASGDDTHVPSTKKHNEDLATKVTSIKAPVSGTSTKVDKNNEVAFQQASGASPAVTVTGDATNGTITISHQTGSGFNHLPTNGAAGKYLKWKTNDDGEWVAPDSTWPANPDNTTIPGTKLVNDRFDTDETNINAVEDMICDDEFNTTTDYNIGDIVTHDHGLYQFKSAHTKGTWNSSHVNQITITDQILDLNRLVRNTQPIYGYRIDKNNLDPDTRVEYLFDAVGMTPAYMNFSTGQFNYGSWGDIWFIKNNKPVALNFDGTEAFELNPTNYWQKSDGTTAIDIEDATLNYNYMSRIPTVYVKRWEDSQYNYVAFTQYPQGGFTAYAHQGASGRINENMYLPMFKGFKDSNGKLRSLAGKTPWNTTGGIGYELDAAKAIATTNNGWQIWDFAKHELISDLLTLISKHTSSRWKFGKGVIKTESSTAGFCKGGYEHDGTTKATCAQFWGTDEGTGNTPSNEDGSHHVRVFHIEDLWGNRWERCLGLHLINGIYKVKMFAPYYATAPTGSGALLPDETYETLSLTPPSGNYLQNQSTGFYGNIPISTSGDKNKGYCSYFWQSSGADRFLLFGGRCDNGFACSARYLSLSSASVHSSWTLGASPCFNHL